MGTRRCGTQRRAGRGQAGVCTPLLLLVTGGCGLVREAAVSSTAAGLEDIVASMRSQSDPEIVRQGVPTLLLTLDSLVASEPDDPELLLAATRAYVAYCQAFVRDDRERAVKLYSHARGYGLRLLRQRRFFETTIRGPLEDYEAALQHFTIDDVPALHAGASAWLGWIIADPDSMPALADLPRALALARRVLELDESYDGGSTHLVFAILFAVQPRGAGQDLERSRKHFERAIELAGPGSFMPRVLYAEYYGKATLDEEFFTRELKQVLLADPEPYPENRLLNELARQRAETLLSMRKDIF